MKKRKARKSIWPNVELTSTLSSLSTDKMVKKIRVFLKSFYLFLNLFFLHILSWKITISFFYLCTAYRLVPIPVFKFDSPGCNFEPTWLEFPSKKNYQNIKPLQPTPRIKKKVFAWWPLRNKAGVEQKETRRMSTSAKIFGTLQKNVRLQGNVFRSSANIFTICKFYGVFWWKFHDFTYFPIRIVITLEETPAAWWIWQW